MAHRSAFSRAWTQFFPSEPSFTEKNIPNLQNKVYIVTGSNTGIGKETARILYSKNAKVYIAARSEEKAQRAIQEIKLAAPGSNGELLFLHLELDDLNSVRKAAQIFQAQERKLHVLFNNAGVMVSPVKPPPTTVQGYELALGVNCVGTFLFTRLLTPTLALTAKSELLGTVRVVWLSSFGLELFGVTDVGISIEDLASATSKPATERYGISKCGAWALGVEYARQHRADGIVSVPINPGNLSSELPRDQGMGLKIAARLLGYPPVKGAYTELFAGLSPEVTMERSGEFGKLFPALLQF